MAKRTAGITRDSQRPRISPGSAEQSRGERQRTELLRLLRTSRAVRDPCLVARQPWDDLLFWAPPLLRCANDVCVASRNRTGSNSSRSGQRAVGILSCQTHQLLRRRTSVRVRYANAPCVILTQLPEPLSPRCRSHCRPQAGAASRDCRRPTGATVSKMYRSHTPATRSAAAAMPTRRLPMAEHGSARGITEFWQNLGLCSTFADRALPLRTAD